MSILKTINLTKDYGQNRGVFDLNISLDAGQIVGFIGPNGAGKSTTMSIIAGFIQPDSGNMEIFDKPLSNQPMHTIYKNIGVLLSENNFESNKKVKTIFKNLASLYDLDLISEYTAMSKMLDLDMNKKFGDLSLGNKKKVNIISAIMHRPKLIILDEPTNGLDPVIQQAFFKILNKIKQDGGSVLLSSHVLSEVENVCDKIIMIKNGNKIFEGSTKEIRLSARKIITCNCIISDEIVNIIKKDPSCISITLHNDITNIISTNHVNIIKTLSTFGIYDFYVERENLEEMFLSKYI